MKGLKDFGALMLEALKEWVRDRAQGLAAGLAYFELLSIAPVVAFILFISGKVLGQQRLYEDVIPLMKSTITPQLTKVIILLLSVEHGMKEGELHSISILSGLLLLWAAKHYFEMIKQIVQTTWNNRRYKFGFKHLINRNIKSMVIALGTVGLLLLSVGISSLLPHPHIQTGVETDLPLIHKFSKWIITIVLVTSLRVFYFTYIPPVKVNWKYTIPGALLGAFLFLIGKEIMSAHFSERPDADAGECVVMVLVWFYYSGLTIIYSSEFTRLYVMQKQNIKIQDLKTD